ncbi:GH25 family lysozyme [Weissella confusa]|uniref:GH25 family lysozyme n=1 Tax=Weissella confusa TaxID=1583 RepID=UPI002A748234|nr:GH25 family lysozyme [Weissella confusa]MDY2521224.1 GH25 family lysozyme [Weissella confusa]
MNKLLKSALASAGALLIMGSVPSVHAAKGDQGVDWSIYQGAQGKFGYGHDKFAIAQIGGYHGYIYDQSTYATQVQYAIAQGKRAHTYMWWQDITDYATADKVLDYFLPKIQTPKESIVALDVESGGQNTDVIMHALQRIKDAGYTPGVYGYKNYLQASTDLQRIANSYALWLAEYPDYNVTPTPNYNYFPSFDNVQLFQFTASYIAGGLDGNVDLTGITDNGYKNGNPSRPNTDTPAVVAGKEADNTPKSDIAAGMTVKVNFSATHYATGETIPDFIKGVPHKVLEVDGDRVLLDDIYSWVSKKNVEILDTNTQANTAEFNGVFVLDSWQYEFGGVYARNEDMAIPVADYHNDMPASAITLTDRFGNPLTDQNGLGNNGVPEYFTLNGRYKVLQRVGSSIEVEMNGESVWLKALFAN